MYISDVSTRFNIDGNIFTKSMGDILENVYCKTDCYTYQVCKATVYKGNTDLRRDTLFLNRQTADPSDSGEYTCRATYIHWQKLRIREVRSNKLSVIITCKLYNSLIPLFIIHHLFFFHFQCCITIISTIIRHIFVDLYLNLRCIFRLYLLAFLSENVLHEVVYDTVYLQTSHTNLQERV